MTTRRDTPMADRLPAHLPVNSHLVAAVARAPADLAERYLASWFAAVTGLCDDGQILVFDMFVVGEPCPLLLEATHHVRMARRADFIAEWDDDADDWTDDCDQLGIPVRVLAALATGQEADRLVDGAAASTSVMQPADRDLRSMLQQIEVLIALERILVSIADSIRIGGAAIVDARLPGERQGRWAA